LTHPQDLPLREQARLLARGELGAGELLEATLARIEERNGPLRAVVATFPEQSRAMLAEAPPGPLCGVPVTIKDMFSLPWRGYRNGTRHELGAAGASGAFRRLRDAGAVVVGVDNQHELGLGTTGRASPRVARRRALRRGWSAGRSAATAADPLGCPPAGAGWWG
jgi:aspartyl-tRNA(Asn)/glutamyl-tRNA(Gln) amidotransferase subunit A